jgi:hypothetical protein
MATHTSGHLLTTQLAPNPSWIELLPSPSIRIITRDMPRAETSTKLHADAETLEAAGALVAGRRHDTLSGGLSLRPCCSYS